MDPVLPRISTRRRSVVTGPLCPAPVTLSARHIRMSPEGLVTYAEAVNGALHRLRSTGLFTDQFFASHVAHGAAKLVAAPAAGLLRVASARPDSFGPRGPVPGPGRRAERPADR